MYSAVRHVTGPSSSAESAPRHLPGDSAFQEQRRSFLRLVSHELRTPLNSILGFSEILAGELYGPLGAPQYREYAAIIQSSGEKLLKLVNQVIEVARWQTGDIELDLQPEFVAPLLGSFKERFALALGERRQMLRVAAPRRLEVLADARGLRLMLTHLLQNAIAYGPDDGEIRLYAQACPEGVELVVANDGDGVDSDDLGRLLRPFEQGANALTRSGEGAGLGLAICDLACRAMGGRLALKSKPGHGFSAHIFLPRPTMRTVAEPGVPS